MKTEISVSFAGHNHCFTWAGLVVKYQMSNIFVWGCMLSFKKVVIGTLVMIPSQLQYEFFRVNIKDAAYKKPKITIAMKLRNNKA